MQDLDYELVYEPGENEKDPLDFISRHPLKETEENTKEAFVKYLVKTEHAVILDYIKEETKTDKQLQKWKEKIQNDDWEVHKNDPKCCTLLLDQTN